MRCSVSYPLDNEIVLTYDQDGRIVTMSDKKEKGLGTGCGRTCPGTGDCCVAAPQGEQTPGCEDPACCDAVCNTPWNDFCCLEWWDEGCAEKAREICSVCETGNPPSGYVYEYAGAGQFQQITDPEGMTQSFSLLCAAWFNPDAYEVTTTYTDVRSNDWTYLYKPYNAADHPDGNLRKVTNPLGNEQALAYDVDRNVTRTTDGLGNQTVYTYDSTGNMLTRTVDPSPGLNLVDTWTYDSLNNVRIRDKISVAT